MLQNAHKQILEHLSVAVLLFNRNLKLSYINAAGEILFADSARHLLDKSADEFIKTSDNRINKDLQMCLNTGEALVDRERCLQLADKSVTVNLSITPLQENFELTGLLIEFQQVDQHLRLSKEEQLMAHQSTSRMLIRGVAHEVKNPLGGIRGAAQLLENELSDPELKEYTNIIIAESDRLQGLVDKMLGPNNPPQKQSINIHEILERIRQLVQSEVSERIEIIANYDPSIPPINADSNMLIQALLNITRNAVQAIEDKGSIIIKSRICRQLTLGRRRFKLVIKIDIIDTGIGIKPEIMSQIFYPMITGRVDGTGLGLSIAQSLINQHSGLIECTSTPGNTVFSIYLPMENGNAP